MINQQLLDYIKQQLAQGVAKETINTNLLSQGWQQGDLNEAFYATEKQDENSSLAFSKLPKKIYMNKTLNFILMIIELLATGFFGMIVVFVLSWSESLVLLYTGYISFAALGGFISYRATKNLSWPFLWPSIYI